MSVNAIMFVAFKRAKARRGDGEYFSRIATHKSIHASQNTPMVNT